MYSGYGTVVWLAKQYVYFCFLLLSFLFVGEPDVFIRQYVKKFQDLCTLIGHHQRQLSKSLILSSSTREATLISRLSFWTGWATNEAQRRCVLGCWLYICVFWWWKFNMMDKIVCPFSFFFAFPIFCFLWPSVFVRQLGREDFQDLCISHARSPWSPLQQYSSTLSQRILRSSHVKANPPSNLLISKFMLCGSYIRST